MLELWIGRANSGKSQRIFEAMKENRDGVEQVFLVPQHASFSANQDVVRFCGAKASAQIEVLHFKSLADRIVRDTLGPKEISFDQGGKILSMHLALMEVADTCEVFQRPSKRVRFLNELVSLADEFHAYRISPEELEAKVSELTPEEQSGKLRDVIRIFAAYERRLNNEHQDSRDLVNKCADLLEGSGFFQGKNLFVDGFALFNRQELYILRIALRQANKVIISLLGDKDETSDAFVEADKAKNQLLRMAQEEGIPVHVEWVPSDPVHTELDHLERFFFQSNRTYQHTSDNIRIYAASTPFEEVEWVASEIRRLVREEGYRYRDIAVTTRHMEAYEAKLENVFLRYEIPAYFSRRSNMIDKPPVLLMTSALNAVSNHFEYMDMFQYLKTGLAGIDAEECDLLDNYAYAWQIRGTQWVSEKPFSRHPDGYGAMWDDSSRKRLERINEIREKVRLPLLHLSNGFREQKSARGKAEILFRFLEEIGCARALEEKANVLRDQGEWQKADEYEQLWDTICLTIDQFVTILQEQPISTESFVQLFELILTQYSIGTIPATVDQVQLSEMTRNDRHNIKVLFLLGATDTSLPHVGDGKGILSESERELLRTKDLELAPSGNAALCREWLNIYAALAQPSEKLVLTYPRYGISGEVQNPSFVISRVENLFPFIKQEVEDNDKKYHFTALKPVLEHLGKDMDGALWKYLEQREDTRAPLEHLRDAKSTGRGKLSSASVKALYGDQLSMSASKVDVVSRCHFSFFMEYGLKAKEHKINRFEAPDIGTFLHYLLEHVVKRVQDADGGFKNVTPEHLEEYMEEYTQTYAEENLSGASKDDPRFRYLFDRLQDYARITIRNVVEEFSCSDFVPTRFEFGFSDGLDLNPLEISSQAGKMKLKGFIDRVDTWEKDGKLYARVVDYKTGKKAFALSDISQGINLQMLLYLFALEKHGESVFQKEIVPAGVLYLQSVNELETVRNRNAKKKGQSQIQRTGLLLNQPEVIRAMEHTEDGTYRFLPIKEKKDGTMEHTASRTQLTELNDFVQESLRKTLKEICSGNINADPQVKNQQPMCAYCAFAGACHFEEGLGSDRYQYHRSINDEEFWENLK